MGDRRMELIFRAKVEGEQQLKSLAQTMGALNLQTINGNTPVAALTQRFTNLANAITPARLGMAAFAGAATTAVTEAFRLAEAAGKLAESQLNFAERTGLTVREVGLFSGAAQLAGVNAESLVGAVKNLSRGLSENSDEGKRAKRALGELGVEVHNQFGGLKGTGDLLLTIGDAFGKIEDPARRVRLAVDLLGRSGTTLLPALRGDLRATVDELKRFGIGMDEDGAKAAARFDDALDKLKIRLQQIKTSLGVGIAENLQRLAPSVFDTRDPRSGKYYSTLRAEASWQDKVEFGNSYLWASGQRDPRLIPKDITGAIRRFMPAAPTSADMERAQEEKAAYQREQQETLAAAGKRMRQRQEEITRFIAQLDE